MRVILRSVALAAAAAVVLVGAVAQTAAAQPTTPRVKAATQTQCDDGILHLDQPTLHSTAPVLGAVELSVPGYSGSDPLLGARVNYSFTSDLLVKFENKRSVATTVTYNNNYTVTLDAPGYPYDDLYHGDGVSPHTIPVPAFDGTDDYLGDSGFTEGGGSGNGSLSIPTTELLKFEKLAHIPVGLSGNRTVNIGSTGTGSTSVSLPGTVDFQLCYEFHSVDVRRIKGADRYTGAVAVSKIAFPSGTNTVYVASGADFPDALSAGPVAEKKGGALLLTPPDQLPSYVAAEIQRLHPTRIVVVGGTHAVSSRVQSQLAAIQPNTDRIAGTDRYDTSRKLIKDAFTTSSYLYVATGLNFPDALSAGGAASHVGAPVLLVPGKSSSIDTATKNFITSLGPTHIRVVGGTVAVTSAIEAKLNTIASTERIGGADRYEVSANVNGLIWMSGSSESIVATGLNFPDALAASTLAGTLDAPIFIAPKTCLTPTVQDAMNYLADDRVTLLGGTAALASSMDSLTTCT